MMKEILKIISEAGVVNESEIAEAVNTTPAMVQQALAVLQHKGYLAAQTCIDSTSGEACCSGCHSKCNKPEITKTFVVTEKGKAYLKTPDPTV